MRLVEFVCLVFGHATPPGVTKWLSIRYCCARCDRVVAGELALRRRRA